MYGDLENKLKLKDFTSYLNKHDIILLNETWTNDNSRIHLEGYESFSKCRFRKQRSKRDSGGIVMFVRNNIAKGVRSVNWDFEDGALLLLKKEYFNFDEDMYIVFVYMRSNNSTRRDLDNGIDAYDILFEKLAEVCHINSSILLAGDMNAHVADHSEIVFAERESTEETLYFIDNLIAPLNDMYTFNDDDFDMYDISPIRMNEDKTTNTYGKRLIDICKASGLIFLNGRKGNDRLKGAYTFHNHIGKSTNDYMICSKDALVYITDFNVHNINIWSDHCAISCIIKCNLQHYNDNTNVGPSYRVSARWKDENKDEYIGCINSDVVCQQLDTLAQSIDIINDKQTADSALLNLTNIMTNAGRANITVSKSMVANKKANYRKNEKWFDEQCAIQRNIFFESVKRYNDDRVDEHRVHMSTERSIYRRMCRMKRKQFYKSDAERMLKISKSDPNKFWKEVKSDKPRHQLPDLDFYTHFRNLAQSESTLGIDGRAETENPAHSEYRRAVDSLDEPFTLTELSTAINNLKKNKSAGIDLILNEFIVNASLQVKLIILTLFNVLLKLEYYPEFWANGCVTPVFKKGNNTDTNNYRGITVLSCIGKLFTRLLNDRLNKWAESESVLTESQFGFRKSRGTTECIFILKGLIDILFARGKKCYVCFVDYTKAYDLLDRSAVFTKLIQNGVSSKYINIIKSLYQKMKLSVKNDPQNREFRSNFGLLQGEVLSPMLFSMFVNDLPEYLSNESVGSRVQDILLQLLMFADDMAIFSETKNGLQTGINDLYRYCEKWGITVNISKTKVVVFKKGGRIAASDTWTYNGEQLEVVTQFKYLGCQLSSSGSFKACISNVTDSARRGLFALKKYFHSNPETLPSVQIQLYKAMIEPILTYCSEIWGLYNSDCIHTFHLAFLKSMLCVKRSTPNCFVYGELGIYPIHIDLKMRVVKFWLKLIRPSTTNENYARQIYKELLRIKITHPVQITWVSKLQDMFNGVGLGHFIVEQQVNNEKEFLTMFKKRLVDVYLDDWTNLVRQTSDGRLYKHIKDTFIFEQYLDMPHKTLRIAITKIRLSSHLFFIERGRWTNLERRQRTCDVCNVIEDEYHVFIECPRYSIERKKLLPNILKTRPSMNEFVKYVRCDSETEFTRVGRLCLSIQKEHKQYL